MGVLFPLFVAGCCCATRGGESWVFEGIRFVSLCALVDEFSVLQKELDGEAGKKTVVVLTRSERIRCQRSGQTFHEKITRIFG